MQVNPTAFAMWGVLTIGGWLTTHTPDGALAGLGAGMAISVIAHIFF